MKYSYKVNKTCHAGGRYCKEGAKVSFDKKVENAYLTPIKEVKPIAKKNPDQKPLSSMGKKPMIKTGMAAGLKEEDK